MRVTVAGLLPGETVCVRRHTSGSLCLLAKRDGLGYTVLHEDGRVRLFDSMWEITAFCLRRKLTWRRRGLVLLEEGRPVSKKERKLLPAFEHEELLPPLGPEWEEVIKQALGEAVEKYAQKQAPKDLERLVFLTEERERLLEELSLELIRREARGNRSCLCRTCLHKLESPVREAQKKIDRIWAWWATSLGTTPADVTAGRWP